MADVNAAVDSSDPIEYEIVRVYRGWDAFERSQDGEEIVDYDLAPAGAAEDFESRTAVLAALESLLERLPDDVSDRQFLHAKLSASALYLRAALGEIVPFDAYVKGTIGVDPQVFPEDLIDKARTPLIDYMCEEGVRFDRADAELFDSRFALTDPAVIRSEIEGARGEMVGRLGEIAHVPKLDRVRIEVTDVDAYWANWLSATRKEGTQLQINVNPRIRYLRGSPTMLVVHELCGHAAQLAAWREAIGKGSLGPASGVTTVHGPESFAAEGLAHLVTRLLIHDTEPDARFARDFVTYRNLVYNNLHYMINTGTRYEDVFDYAYRRLPFDSPDRIERDIRDRTLNLVLRAYQYVYGIAEQTFLSLLSTDSATRRRVLTEFYWRTTTAEQSIALINAAVG